MGKLNELLASMITKINRVESKSLGYMDSDNTIILDGVSNGDYILKLESWSDVIADTNSIPVSVTDDRKEYSHLLPENCAPVGTRRIGVYSADGKNLGAIRLGNTYRRNTIGDKLYSFGLISDVHYPYETAADDFHRALTYFNDIGVAFVCITGDLTSQGSVSELKKYRNAIDTYSPNTPVYAATGNHEGVNANIRFIVKDQIGTPLYYKVQHGDDVFLFVGCKSNVTGELFTKEELQWLYEELELNRNKRCFVFEHVRPEDGCGNALGIYTNDIWGGTEQMVFESLMKHYKNAILCHGHSHLKLYMQEFSDIANYDHLFGGHSIHVPSIAVPRDTTSIVDPSITEVYADSEGYVVDVYEHGIMLRGRDFVAERFFPVATYWLNTDPVEIPAQSYVDHTGTIDTSIVRDMQLSWTQNMHVDRDTGEALIQEHCAFSGPIPANRLLRYRVVLADYDVGSGDRNYSVVLCCYAEDGAYLGYDYLLQYNRKMGDACFIPHEGTAYFRLALKGNASNAAIARGIQRLSLAAESAAEYTNLVPLSTETDGTPYNGEQGWKKGYYATSADGGGDAVRDGMNVTGYIPYMDGQVVCVKNLDLINSTGARVTCYDESFKPLFYANIYGEWTFSQWRYGVSIDSDKRLITFDPYAIGWKHQDGTVKYIRISAEGLDADSVVTVGEPMLWEQTTVEFGWVEDVKIEEGTGAETLDTNYVASEMIPLEDSGRYFVSCSSSHQLGISYIWYDVSGTYIGYAHSVRKTTDTTQTFLMTEQLEPPPTAASMKIRISEGRYWTAEEVAEKVTVAKRF